MKSQNNRLFWTAFGSRILGKTTDYSTENLPPEMKDALRLEFPLPAQGSILRGTDLEGKKGRHVYMYTWKILREIGFSRPLRIQVFPEIELYMPFVRNDLAVIPQGFRNRVPLDLRALALVGKNTALKAKGINLIVVAATYEKTTWDILEQGRCSVCTPDKLKQLVLTLDLSQ